MELELGDGRVQFLFVVAVISGLALTALSQDRLLLGLLSVLGGDFHSYGVFEMEIDTGRCEFHPPEHQIPKGAEQLVEQEGEECVDYYEAYVLEARIQMINDSTDKQEVKEQLSRAHSELNSDNVDSASAILDRVEVERTFSVSEQ